MYQIPVEKISEDVYKITKNVHLEYLIKGTYGFFYKIKNGIKVPPGSELVAKDSFLELIEKLLSDDKTVTFSKNEINNIRLWIDAVVILVLEWETTDFKNKEIKKYIKMTQNFIEEINKLIPIQENII